MKKIMLFLCFISVLFVPLVKAEQIDLAENAKSAILMEPITGKVLYKKNENEKLAPASMTKVMSMVLIMEELEKGNLKLNEKIMISQNAASMGGSQLFLQPNTEAKVEDLLKGIAIASGNDAVVAMAERIGGSVEKFVEMMNNKAKELGLKNTHFVNPHGLDEEDHYTSANDMAIMAKALIQHEKILKYTSIYEEYLTKSDGTELWMVNTNKLVKFYEGVDGLKTGFTQNAGYCLTATAKKNNMRLISVVMGEDTSANRSADTVELLNYGFNSYKLNTIVSEDKDLGKIRINKGKEEFAKLKVKKSISQLLSINEKVEKYEFETKLNNVTAPVKEGDKVGVLKIKSQGKTINTTDITVKGVVKRANFWDLYKRNAKLIISGK